MADVLNRSTKELRHSVHSPDYDQAEWLINPDLSAVDGVPRSRWIIDGDSIRLPDAGETAAFDAADLAAAKEAKINAINAKTGQLIESGSVIINGVSISTALTNQVSLQAIDALVSKGLTTWPQPISAIDGTSYAITSLNDFNRVAGIVATFVMTTKAVGRMLRAQVLAADSIAAVSAVEDNR